MTPLRLRVILCCALTLLALHSTAYAAPSLLATNHYDALLKSASAKNTPTPKALSQLYAARRVRMQVPTTHAAASLLQAQQTTNDPLVRAAIVRMRARVLQDLGDVAQGPRGTKGDLKTLGCLTSFSMVGPFPNASMENVDATLAPELGESGPYDGRGGQIDWRTIPDVSSMCRLNINKTLSTSGDSIVYLAATLTSKRAQKLKLMLGANGIYRIWLNGKPVAVRDTNTGLALDNDAWDVSLKRGANTLLIKLASDQTSGLDLMARVVDAKLKPALDVIASPGWAGQPVEKVDLTSLPKASEEGVLAQVKAWTAKSTGDDAVWGAWLWQLVERANVAVPWRDVATKVEEQVIGGVTLSAQAYELLPRLYEEHWKRVHIMERARKAHPTDPWIATSMARLNESSISDARRMSIRGLLEQTLKAHPTHLRAVEMLSDWYERRGLHIKALQVLKAYATPQTLKSPQFAMELINAQKTYGDRAKANALRREVYNQTQLRSGYAWTMLKEYILKKESDKATALIQHMRKVYPWSSVWLEQHINVLRTQNKNAEALALYDEALAIRPDDTDLMQGKASLLVAQGQREEAAKLLTLALSVRPQDTEIRERIAHLRPDENRFHEEWMVDDIRALAKQAKAGPFDSTTILDQTIVRVGTNGLSQKVTQVVERVNTTQGVRGAKYQRIGFQGGDERVEVLQVKIHKKDGSISDDYDTWTTDGSRKANTTYNDSGTVNVRANNVEVGDMVEVRYRVSEIANQNFRGDYFGDISYVQGTNPIGMTRYTILYPKAWTFYFRKPSLPHTRTDNTLPSGKAVSEGLKSTSFTLKAVPDVKTDPNQPGHTSVYDYILVSNKKTYNEIGAWWWNLVKEQLIVDENIRAKVKELVKGLKTEDQKLAAIHNYVVQNTRYLHVGLGIHGWKPYRTSTCFRNRYGDCKDKAALLKVMLEEAGIPANLVLVRTRRLGKVEANPASMHIFNHAITYVPSKNLYLDGTAEFNGTSELTSMDQGAQALIVKDGGNAQFVTLPVDKPSDNMLSHTLEVDLTGKEPVAKGTLVATGSNAVYYRTSLEDPTRRKDLFEKQLSNQYPGATLVDATFSDLKALEKPVTITYTFKGGELLRSAASRQFVYPLGRPRDMIRSYAAQSTRNQALTIRVPFSTKTTITYKLDPSKAWGQPLSPMKLKSKFGHLELKAVKSQETLKVHVSYGLAKQQVSAKDYPEFRTFITTLNSALNATTEVQKEKTP